MDKIHYNYTNFSRDSIIRYKTSFRMFTKEQIARIETNDSCFENYSIHIKLIDEDILHWTYLDKTERDSVFNCLIVDFTENGGMADFTISRKVKNDANSF